MNKLFFTLLFIALAAYGQLTSVAVLPSDGTASNEELEALTDEMREAALKVLPTNTFVLLKQDVVVKRLGGAENFIKECRESTCIVDLGKKAQVDYVTQASVFKLGNSLRLKVELYNVRTEGLIAMFNDEAEEVRGLLAVVKNRAPEVFGKILSASSPQSAVVAVPVPIVELLGPVSVAQALSGSNLPKGCAEDFTNLLGKDSFDMVKFMKQLPIDVAKVKLQLKSPFGKPKDSDKTNSGLTVGCVKALPESPAEITSLLKDISLKMGLDLAVDAVADVVDNHIPANVATESKSSGGWFKPIMSISLATVGLGAITYGYMKNREIGDIVYGGVGSLKDAENAKSSRNVSYGIGAALLAGGLTFYLVF